MAVCFSHQDIHLSAVDWGLVRPPTLICEHEWFSSKPRSQRCKRSPTCLTLQLLREREQRTEQRLQALEAQLRVVRDDALAPLAGSAPRVPEQQEMPSLVCHPTEKRTPLIPLIEYGARGQYVLISPEEGELLITPDSPEWFAWLASLSSFRFVGKSGRFSARRGYNRGPNRSWYAQRGIHQKNYSKYLGVSEHLTTVRLEQVAAHFQSYLTLR
jgi:hypothetical protein